MHPRLRDSTQPLFISTMRVGETAYTGAAAMWLDIKGCYWLDGSREVLKEPWRTALRLHRTALGFVVDGRPDYDYYTNPVCISGRGLLPVILYRRNKEA